MEVTVLAQMQLEMRQRQKNERDMPRSEQFEPRGPYTRYFSPCKKGHPSADKDAHGHCKTCRKEKYHRSAAVREREKAAVRRRRQRNAAEYILAGLKRQAKKRGQEFRLKPIDILPLPEFCPALGIKISYSEVTKDRSYWPSVDRFDATQGYIPGNVSVISYRANWIKQNSTVEELEKITAWMRKIIAERKQS